MFGLVGELAKNHRQDCFSLESLVLKLLGNIIEIFEKIQKKIVIWVTIFR